MKVIKTLGLLVAFGASIFSSQSFAVTFDVVNSVNSYPEGDTLSEGGEWAVTYEYTIESFGDGIVEAYTYGDSGWFLKYEKDGYTDTFTAKTYNVLTGDIVWTRSDGTNFTSLDQVGGFVKVTETVVYVPSGSPEAGQIATLALALAALFARHALGLLNKLRLQLSLWRRLEVDAKKLESLQLAAA